MTVPPAAPRPRPLAPGAPRWRLPRALLVACLVAGLAVFVLARSLWARLRPVGAAPTGPNVLLVLTDDMRYDGLTSMPTLRGLAERGVTFSQAFVTTPLCAPSRASILTGQYARHQGVVSNHAPSGGFDRFDDRSTLVTWLQAGGVRTGLVGKYLNEYRSEYIPPGWEFWFGLPEASEQDRMYFGYRANDNGERQFYGSSPDEYSTRVLGRQALRFLREDRRRPFVLEVATRAPHSPAAPDPLDSGALKGSDLPLPPSFNEEDVSDKPSLIRNLRPLGRQAQAELDTFRRRQFESLMGVDRMIGDLVDELRSDGRLDSTWIIFTSDNGVTIGEHRLDAGKSCPYEECVRVPLIVVPPGGLDGPRTDGRLAANIDLAPTIAAIMGVEPAAPVDGVSLLPLLSDPSAPGRDALMLEMFFDDEAGNRFTAVRTTDRKYVAYPNGEAELYDEVADPYELENLAANPNRSGEMAELAGRLAALLSEGPK